MKINSIHRFFTGNLPQQTETCKIRKTANQREVGRITKFEESVRKRENIPAIPEFETEKIFIWWWKEGDEIRCWVDEQ